MSFKSILVTMLLLSTGVFVQADTIWEAAEHGDVDAVQQFINQDKDGKLVNQQNDIKATPLHFAAHNGHEEVVRLLLSHPKIQVNQQNFVGRTPLLLAAERGYEGVVRLLIGHPNILVNQQNKWGWTPLYAAADRSHEGVVRLLIGHPKILVNQQNLEGETPLYLAANNLNEEVVRQLLTHGADPRIANDYGRTPLHIYIVQEVLAQINMRHTQLAVLTGLHARTGAASPLLAINNNIDQILSYQQPEFFVTPTMTQRVLTTAQNTIGDPRFLAAVTVVAVVGFATLRLFHR